MARNLTADEFYELQIKLQRLQQALPAVQAIHDAYRCKPAGAWPRERYDSMEQNRHVDDGMDGVTAPTPETSPAGLARQQIDPKRHTAADRIRKLLDETRELKETNRALEEDLSAAKQRIAGLEEKLQKIEVDSSELERLKKFEDEVRNGYKRSWERFLQRCQATAKRHGDFAQCFKTAQQALSQGQFLAIADLPNGPDVILFIGRSEDFRKYLGELNEAAAIDRIRQTGLRLEADEMAKELQRQVPRAASIEPVEVPSILAGAASK